MLPVPASTIARLRGYIRAFVRGLDTVPGALLGSDAGPLAGMRPAVVACVLAPLGLVVVWIELII